MKFLKLRKRFNLPDPLKKLEVLKQWLELWRQADKVADEWNASERATAFQYNDTCPACKTRGAVERIVALKRYSFSGSNDTEKVSHCSKCGNDWEKLKPRKKHADEILKMWLRWFKEDFDKDMETSHGWKPFANVYAETIVELYGRAYDFEEKVKLKKLRQKMKSVFDN
jgi:superfamily II helicase